MTMMVDDAYLLGLLKDDCPSVDLTTMGLGIGAASGVVRAQFKAPGIVAGVELAARLFELSGARVDIFAADGDRLEAGVPILAARGTAQNLHRVYKVAQTLMEYACGIARVTNAMVTAARAENPKVHVAATRKHMPGAKPIALAGVFAGGGIVHRLGLSDSILVFDQHLVFCSDADASIRRLKAASPERKVAVEVGSPEDAVRMAKLGVDIIQCERMTPDVLTSLVPALHAVNPGIVVSAAGGINEQTAAAYARAGLDLLVTSRPYQASPFDVKMVFCAEAAH